MNKITIIGLDLVGNSIGMGIKSAYGGSGAPRITGFDPDRSRETAALRTHASVDEIAPDLESAVKDAQMVVISTPVSAAREVMSAISPYLDSATVVTDTLSIKAPVMSWAGELLGGRVSFVGGHPVPRAVDIEAAAPEEKPSADLFAKSPYCIMPLPNAGSDALNTVIGMAQALGARPLFMDPAEHDSYFAAVSSLPVVISAALMKIVAGSPSWRDLGSLARDRFGSVTDPLGGDPERLREALTANRQALLYWLDAYAVALRDLRDAVEQGDPDELQPILAEGHRAREGWLRERETAGDEDPFSARRPDQTPEAAADLRRAIQESNPARGLFGNYLVDKFWGKKKP